MKKFLYITDREEYSEHNFIGPLFEKYLPEHMKVDIVYLSKFKSYLDNNNGHFIVPDHEKKDILKFLSQNDIDVSSYDYVVVRNMHEILANIIAVREKYGIKVGFRLSFPKIAAKLEHLKSENKSSLLKKINQKLKVSAKSKLINQCDVFMPTSKIMQEVYYPDVTTKIHVVPSAIDPSRVSKKVSRGDEKIVFAYEGTISKLRNFELVLEAFCALKSENWELLISTKDEEYAKSCVSTCSKIADKVQVSKASNKEELLALIARCDVGLALLPDINIFSTSVHLKIIDYYTSAVPSLMSKNTQNSSLFTHEKDAWLCDFDAETIAAELEKIIATPKDKIRAMGQAGQNKLLEIRNYEVIAKELAQAMEAL